jgi:hypothetical protein
MAAPDKILLKVVRSTLSSRTNVEERFVRVSDYPTNANMDAMKVRLCEFGTCLTYAVTVMSVQFSE